MKEIIIKAQVSLASPNKRKVVKEWVIGFPQYNWVSHKGYMLEEIKTKEGASYYVYLETVCLDTNLKDSKGNNIFNNDIIEVRYEGEEPKKWVVCFNKLTGTYRLKMYEGHGERMIFPLNERAVVIGNIIDKK
tara:strand:+ start:784 stop:1182 length:399 start_codon:yes stop_codon:yes gene_type:complete